MKFEIAQDASSLKWFLFVDGLMDTDHAFNTEKEAVACAAAAPEMKAALEEVIRVETSQGITHEDFDAVIEMVEAALAKAEGK